MLSLWQSGCYRLMDEHVPYPSTLPTAEGAPTPYKDEHALSGARAPDKPRSPAPAPPPRRRAKRTHPPKKTHPQEGVSLQPIQKHR